jgi:UDP-glucose 4-epimerase
MKYSGSKYTGNLPCSNPVVRRIGEGNLRVLVTGSEGNVGRTQTLALREAGHEVRTLDRAAQRRGDDWEHIPGNVCDIDVLRRAVHGMDAVIHLAAIPNDRRGGGPDVLTVNVQGTWNLLFACLEAGVPRLTLYSSVNALGCVGGHRPTEYLPVDDDYPRHPMTPYQLSKHLAEETCRSFTEKYGLVTICLRPVYVAHPEHYLHLRARTEERKAGWERHELFAYVDVRDVVAAGLHSLTAENITHAGFLLTADDTTMATPTAELIEQHYSVIPCKQDMAAYLADNPHRSLMDCSHAKQVLGWQPKHSWRE